MKHSQDKHESDIPRPTHDRYVDDYIEDRTHWLSHVCSQTKKEPENLEHHDLVDLIALYNKQADGLTRAQQKKLFVLEKRFVVKGFILDKAYSVDAQSEYFACFYLADMLLELASQNDLNALNSGIRLLDYAKSMSDENSTLFQPTIAEQTLRKELTLVASLSGRDHDV